MTADLDRPGAARMARRGVLALSPTQALAAFDAALGTAASQVLAVRLDATALDDRPLLSALRTVGAATAPVASLVDTWAATPPALRRAAVASFVQEQARKVLGLPAATAIDPRQPFQELGLDSLMAVELRNAIGAALARPQSATLLFDHPTTGSLVDHLLAAVGDEDAARPAATTAPAPAPEEFEESDVDVAGIAALSEDEAEALLLAELGIDGGSS